MGKVLYRIFKKVEAEGGVAARLKFAQTTKVSLETVKKVKDRPEYIRKFQLLASQILEKDVNELFPSADKAASKAAAKKPPKKTNNYLKRRQKWLPQKLEPKLRILKLPHTIRVSSRL